jgi:2-keto-3-deoxy-L-rhamnonate aldolase RhmA
MIENTLKRTLAAGGTAIGTMVCDTRTPAIAQALAVAGLDFFILDAEHGAFSLETVADMMLMARFAKITPIVRVPDGAYPFVARVLDAGAMGVMVPRVKTRAQVEAAVRAVKYPPMGERGMMNARTNTSYLPMSIKDYGAKANQETMLIVQIETREAVEDIAGIVAVPGVDAVLMGPADLSVSLGTMDTNTPIVTDSIQRVLDAATRQGIAAGTHVGDLPTLKVWRDKGMRLLMYNYDFGLMMGAATAAAKELRG